MRRYRSEPGYWMIRAACVMAVIGMLLMADPAAALQLSPLEFVSLGSLSATSDIVLNTDTLQLSGGASFTGGLEISASGSLSLTNGASRSRKFSA